MNELFHEEIQNQELPSVTVLDSKYCMYETADNSRTTQDLL